MFDTILKPALWVLDRVGTAVKFTLVSVVFLGAALLPTSYMVRRQNLDLRTLRDEQQGLAALGPVHALTRHATEHLLAGPLAGGGGTAGGAGAERPLESAIEGDFRDLGENRALDYTLEGSAGAQEALTAPWKAILATRDPAGSRRAHLTFLYGLKEWNARVMDGSGIILDADLAFYYVADMALVKLPAATLLLLEAGAKADRILDGHPLSQDEKLELDKLIGEAESRLETMVADMAPARGFSRREIAQSLGVRLREQQEAAHAFLKAVGGLASGTGPRILPAGLRFAETEATGKGFLLQEAARKVMARQVEHRIQTSRWLQAGYLGVAGAAALLAFYLLAGVYRSLQRGLTAMGASLRALARGDLTLPSGVASRDELGALAQDLEHARQGLGDLVRGVQQVAETIAEAAAAIAQSSAELAARTEAQAASLLQTAQSLEEISATAGETGRTAQAAGADALRMGQLVQECREAVGRAWVALSETRAASSRAAEVTQVVDEIAFRANLLAVDAVVASAEGDRERGFSMLASEVHGLGRRGAEASREIKALLNEGRGLLEEGERQAGMARASVQSLEQDLRQVALFIGAAGHGASEQAVGVSQVSEALGQLEVVTQSNAAMVVQASAASGALAAQAERLKEQVSRFVV